MENWMDAEMTEKPDVVIVDIGYVTDESARDRADKMFALGIGKKNLIWGPSTGAPRIHMHIPKSKVTKVMETLPIQAKKTWFGATHSWLKS